MASNKDGTDILMQLCIDSGPVEAECQTQVDASDSFVSDYSNGTFFEVDTFSFGMKIDDQDISKDKLHSTGQSSGLGGTSLSGRMAPGKDQDKAKRNKSGPFGRWKSASAEELKTMKRYPVRMDEFSITRMFDSASPILFKYCCDSGSFKTASLVKRKDVGGRALQGFLRLEFEDLLVTHVGWDNGDDIKEKFKFVFRKLSIRYRATSFKTGQSQAVLQDLPTVTWSYDTEIVNSKQAL